MKRKIYTKSHSEDLLREIDNDGGEFTAAEHAYIIEKDFGKEYETKESLMRHYLNSGYGKLSALGFLIKYVNDNGFKNVISLGAGQCVLEYLLKCALTEDSNVIAADFDMFFIKKAKLFFPSIIPVEFDFFKDDINDLSKKLGMKFDIAVFFGSSYVMDDYDFIKLFRGLKEIGVKRIIDFQAGYIPFSEIPKTIASKLKSYVTTEYRGKFHGYSRTCGEVRRLYKQAGIDLIQETAVGNYKYVSISR